LQAQSKSRSNGLSTDQKLLNTCHDKNSPEVGVVPDDEYVLAPKNELDQLRQQIEGLRMTPAAVSESRSLDGRSSASLIESIDHLNANIARLNQILEGANDDMVKAFQDMSVQQQLTKMAEQNEKLARGIIAVAELVKGLEPKQPNPFEKV
jgi:hypothetical protein